MEVAKAAEGRMAWAGRTHEAIKAFSELRRSCERLCKAPSRCATRPIRRIQGAIPKGIAPFPFYGEECKSVERWNEIGGEIPESEAENLKTVGDVTKFIESKLKK